MSLVQESISAITDEELSSINYAIQSRYGLDFTDYEPSSLKRRIVRIIHKHSLENVIGLWQKLLYDKDFIQIFKDEVSVGLTEMFRNPEIWVALRDIYLPEIARNKKDDINIWHAGCSTGEEVHTMAMVAHDAMLLNRCKALATDLSDSFVAISQAAVYEKDLCMRYMNNIIQYDPKKSWHYCFEEIDSEKVKIQNRYTDYAVYKQHNLTSIPIEKNLYDIIFCRNVMIYFNDNLKMNLLRMFHSKLKDGGLLIIGYFDAMPSNFEQYFTYKDSSLKFFAKK